MTNEDTCYLCLRIPSVEVLKTAHKIWLKPKLARSIGLQATELIAKIYKEHPIFFCGRQKKVILASIFYYLSIINNVRTGQRVIAEHFVVTEPAIRQFFHKIVKLLHNCDMKEFWGKWGRSGGLHPFKYGNYAPPTPPPRVVTVSMETKLEKRLREYGYTLYKIKRFRQYDKIFFGNQDVHITAKLHGKLEDFDLYTLVNVCT